jgi:hypothetical protein
MHQIIDKKFYLGPKFGTLINKKWITISELLQLYRASLCRSEDKNLLSVALGRRVRWCVILSYCLSCLCKNLDACNDLIIGKQVLLYLGPVLAFMSVWWWCWWCSCLSLISCPWYLFCSSQVACPTPPCAWLPSLPALHLLGAWPAPCCSRSCLSNHVYWLGLLVLVWWGEFTLDAHLMSRENYVSVGCDCSQWCVSDLCWCGCAGAVMLVMLCWCCGVGDVVLVMLVD